MEITSTPAWLAPITVGAGLTLGAYAVVVLDLVVGRALVGSAPGWGEAALRPFRRASLLLTQERISTERPDAPAWALAPALYGGLAALAVTVVPLSPTWVVADVQAGIVLWGMAEALAMVAVYLHGWSPNSAFPLIGGYRFVAQAIAYELLSMFVLIAAALPAGSMQMTAIVQAQEGLWNAVRHPPALPLWIVVTLGVAFWGPLRLSDAPELAGGTSAETSGSHRLVWEASRAAMLVAFCAMGAAALLGGWLGPWLPGPVWMILKTLALLVVTLSVGHVLARFRPQRFVKLAWTVLLPLAFLDLAIAGIEALP